MLHVDPRQQLQEFPRHIVATLGYKAIIIIALFCLQREKSLDFNLNLKIKYRFVMDMTKGW